MKELPGLILGGGSGNIAAKNRYLNASWGYIRGCEAAGRRVTVQGKALVG